MPHALTDEIIDRPDVRPGVNTRRSQDSRRKNRKRDAGQYRIEFERLAKHLSRTNPTLRRRRYVMLRAGAWLKETKLGMVMTRYGITYMDGRGAGTGSRQRCRKKQHRQHFQ
jgi:hypothetical protein